jgi:hypothetical protein
MMKRMTRADALALVAEKTQEGYYQAELQYIWDHEPDQPVANIMSFGFTKAEATRLWNARLSQDDPFAGRIFHLVKEDKRSCGAPMSNKAAFTVNPDHVTCAACKKRMNKKAPATDRG